MKKRLGTILATISAISMLGAMPILAEQCNVQKVTGDVNQDGIDDCLEIVMKDTNNDGQADFHKYTVDMSSDGKSDFDMEMQFFDFNPRMVGYKVDCNGDGKHDIKIDTSCYNEPSDTLEIHVDIDTNNDGAYDQKAVAKIRPGIVTISVDEDNDGTFDKTRTYENFRGGNTIVHKVKIPFPSYETELKDLYMRLTLKDKDDDGVYEDVNSTLCPIFTNEN